MKKRWVSLLAVFSLLLVSVFPTVYADEETTEPAAVRTETDEATGVVTTTFEAETVLSDTTYKNESTVSGGTLTYFFADGQFLYRQDQSGKITNEVNQEISKPAAEPDTIFTVLDGTKTGNVFYLGEYDLTGLYEFSIRLAFNENNAVKYRFYVDGTKNALGLPIACVDAQKTGGWGNFKEFTAPLLPEVDAGHVQGTHRLYLAIEYTQNSANGGNFDWFSWKQAKVEDGVASYRVTHNFWDDKATQQGGSQDYLKTRVVDDDGKIDDNHATDTYGVGNTHAPIVLSYEAVSFSGLKHLSLSYVPQGKSTMQVYKGSRDTTPILTITLDNEKLSDVPQWYHRENLRWATYDLELDMSGIDTLWFVFTPEGNNYTGTYVEFSLHYEEALAPTCRVEGENYIWGASNEANDWSGSKTDPNNVTHQIINNTKPGDTFYLGEADLTNLKVIAPYVARGANGTVTYEFYIDMTIVTPLACVDESARKYNPASAVSGGTLIASATIGQTDVNQWNTFRSFPAPVTDGLSGKHKVYMKLSGSGWCGCIDYIEFVGVTSFDTTLTTPVEPKSVAVTFYGRYNTVIAEKTVTSSGELQALLDSGVVPPTIYGFSFAGWDNQNAEELYGSAGETVSVKAGYVADEKTTCSVTATGCTLTVGGESVSDDNISFDNKVTATANEKGVAYWLLDGAKVGFNANEYSFYASGDNNIQPVYTTTGGYEEPTTPSVVIQQSHSAYNGETYTWTIIAQTSLPNGTFDEYGVIYSNDAEKLNALTINTKLDELKTSDGYLRVKSSGAKPNIQYMTNLLQIQPGRTRYAVAYVVVDETVYYSAVETYTAQGGES